METIKNYNLFNRSNKEVSETSYPNKSFKEKYKGKLNFGSGIKQNILKWEDYEGGFGSIQSFLHKLMDDTHGKNWGKTLVKEDFDWDEDDFDEEEYEYDVDAKPGDRFLCTQNILDPRDFRLKFNAGSIYKFVEIINGKVNLIDDRRNNNLVSFSGLNNLFRKL